MTGGIIQDFLDEAGSRMQKSVDATRAELATVRTVENSLLVASTDFAIRL